MKPIELSEFAPQTWARLEQIVDQFEEQWQNDRRPDIVAFLTQHEHERRALLTELLQVDLEYRVRAGDDAPLEQWVAGFPELQADHALLVELIGREIDLKRRRGHAVSADDYVARFPSLVEQITECVSELPESTTDLRHQATQQTRSAAPHRSVTQPEPNGARKQVRPGDGPADDSTESIDAERLLSLINSARSASDEPTGLDTPNEAAEGESWVQRLIGNLAPVESGLDELPQSLRSFGNYELLRVIARGGMGVVYLARQVALNRTVAIKMIRSGWLASDADIHRFRREAEAAAGLKHPGIVAVHDVGEVQGLQYFSMDYIAGTSLTQLLKAGPLAAPQAAELAASVAEAVQHAHEHGILHRDLKPSNILVDGGGRPHITDFGLARWMDDDSGLTLTEQALGTPSYMPPEQISRRFGESSPQSDVYSLGATLYEMLTGRPPFVAASRLERVELVLHQEPTRLRLLNAHVPVDLETICLKCLQKEARQRYESARELAVDLRRFLQGEPVAARPVSALERTVRWCRRHPALALTAAIATLLLSVILVGSPIAAMLLRQERDRAVTAEAEARDNEESVRRTLFQSFLNEAEASRFSRREGQRFHTLDVLQQAGQLAGETHATDADILRARHLAVSCLALPDLREMQRWPVDTHRVGIDPSFRYFAYCEAEHSADEPSIPDSPNVDQPESAASGTAPSRTIVIRHLTTGRPCLRLVVPEGVSSFSSRISPQFTASNEYVVATSSERPPRDVLVWQLPDQWSEASFATEDSKSTATLKPVTRWKATRSLALSPDGRLSIDHAADRRLVLREIASGQFLAEWTVPLDRPNATFAPTGRHIAVIGTSTRILIYELPAALTDTNQQVSDGSSDAAAGDKAVPELIHDLRHPWDRSRIYSIGWRADGELLACGTVDGALHVWNVPQQRVVANLKGHRHTVFHTEFHPTRNLLVSCGWDGAVCFWNTAGGELLLQTDGSQPTFRADGQQMAFVRATGGSHQLIVSEFSAAPEHQILWDSGADRLSRIYSLTFTADDDELVSAEASGVRQWSVKTGQHQLLSSRHSHAVVYDRTSDRIVAATEQGIVSLQTGDSDLRGSRVEAGSAESSSAETSPLPNATSPYYPHVTISRDGNRIAGTSGTRHVLVWQEDRNAPRILDDMDYVRLTALDPTGRWLAVYPRPGLRVIDLDTGDSQDLMASVGGYFSLKFSPDGRWLVNGERTQYRFWDVSSWRQTGMLPREGDALYGAIDFSPDGRLLAVSHTRSVVRLHDTRTLELLAQLEAASQFRIAALAFSPDGSQLAVANEERMIHTWNLTAIRKRLRSLALDWSDAD